MASIDKAIALLKSHDSANISEAARNILLTGAPLASGSAARRALQLNDTKQQLLTHKQEIYAFRTD